MLVTMKDLLTIFLDWLVKFGGVALVANEIRGFVLAGPVFYGLYQSGGTIMAFWLAVSSLIGIAISVLLPLFVLKKRKQHRTA